MYDVEKLLSKMLSKELQFAAQIEIMKQDISSYMEFDPKAVFDEIDVEGTHYLDTYNLKQFLMRHAYLPNDNLLMAIIRRIDLDCDAKLNFAEFYDAVRPYES